MNYVNEGPHKYRSTGLCLGDTSKQGSLRCVGLGVVRKVKGQKLWSLEKEQQALLVPKEDTLCVIKTHTHTHTHTLAIYHKSL